MARRFNVHLTKDPASSDVAPETVQGTFHLLGILRLHPLADATASRLQNKASPCDPETTAMIIQMVCTHSNASMIVLPDGNVPHESQFKDLFARTPPRLQILMEDAGASVTRDQVESALDQATEIMKSIWPDLALPEDVRFYRVLLWLRRGVGSLA